MDALPSTPGGQYLVDGPAVIRIRVGRGTEGFPYGPPGEVAVKLVIPA